MAEDHTPRVNKTTETSFEIIEAIKEQDGATLTELANHLHLAKSTIHKHLATLYKHDYVLKEGREYHLGFKFLNMGEYIKSRKEIYKIAKRKIQKLENMTGEEVDFTVENQGRLVTIHENFDEKIKSLGFRSGVYNHMHDNAAGKAILAEFTRERVEEIIETWGLPEKTDNTITSSDELHAELEQVRDRGYAINDEEYLRGLRAVGATVTKTDGSVCGAMSVTGPTYRMKEDILHKEIPDTLLSVIDEFQEEL